MWRFLPVLLAGCALETADLESFRPDVCKAAVICSGVVHPIDGDSGLEFREWTCTASPDRAQCWTPETEILVTLEPPEILAKAWFEDGCFLELVCTR